MPADYGTLPESDPTSRTDGAAFSASVINLLKAIIGSGILAFPYCFAQVGLVPALILLFGGALLQAYTADLLVQCVQIMRDKDDLNGSVSFKSLAENSLPGEHGKMVIEAIVGVFTLGCSISYLVVMGDLMPQIAEDAIALFGFKEKKESLSIIWEERSGAEATWIVFLALCIGFPLCCLKSVKSLQFTSMLGNFGIGAIVVILILYATNAIDAHPDPTTEPMEMFAMTASGVRVFSIFIFGFSCNQSLPGIITEMKDSSYPTVRAMVNVSLAITALVYLLIGSMGYMVYGSLVNADLLQSLPLGLAACLARLAIVLNVIGSFPLYQHSTRSSFSLVLYQHGPDTLSDCEYYALTITTFAVALVVAISVPGLDVVLGYVGATGGCLVAFTLPAYFYLKQADAPSSWAAVVFWGSWVLMATLVATQTWDLMVR
uniref:Amino acid transporter transmembrane domain-containing protein n=1 Tax=Lotharella globosa TaxID=91324 RepID=A0A7S3Z7E9_9EUKA